MSSGTPDVDLKGIYLVFTGPVEGQENAYNRWYNEEHIPDLMAAPGGFDAAQRWQLGTYQRPGGTPSPFRYLCTYEIRHDIEETFAAVDAAQASGMLRPSAALAMERSTHLWVPLGKRHTRSGGTGH